MFVSTFTAAYEVEDNVVKELNKEGSLYILERSQQPTLKLFLLNRKEREDLTDWITDKTEFKEKENFVSYTTTVETGQQVRRIFYFAVTEEKDRFLNQVKFNARAQVRDELLRLVQTDEFIDLVIDRLKSRLQGQGSNLL